jgi:CheY-like chemotaxis protein
MIAQEPNAYSTMDFVGTARSPRCLIVEDQVLIGMGLEACLEDAGYEVVGVFGTGRAALQSLETATPDVALVDYMLNDGCCLAVVRALTSRGIPFVVYSGVRRPSDLGPEFQHAPWLEKPIGRSDLLDAIAKLVRSPLHRSSLSPALDDAVEGSAGEPSPKTAKSTPTMPDETA